MTRSINISALVKEYKRDRAAYHTYTRKEFKVDLRLNTYNGFLVWINRKSLEAKISKA